MAACVGKIRLQGLVKIKEDGSWAEDRYNPLYYLVKVEKVATTITHGKWKRHGKSIGQRPDRKKAIITLKKGEKLEFIEGA